MENVNATPRVARDGKPPEQQAQRLCPWSARWSPALGGTVHRLCPQPAGSLPPRVRYSLRCVDALLFGGSVPVEHRLPEPEPALPSRVPVECVYALLFGCSVLLVVEHRQDTAAYY